MALTNDVILSHNLTWTIENSYSNYDIILQLCNQIELYTDLVVLVELH